MTGDSSFFSVPVPLSSAGSLMTVVFAISISVSFVSLGSLEDAFCVGVIPCFVPEDLIASGTFITAFESLGRRDGFHSDGFR